MQKSFFESYYNLLYLILCLCLNLNLQSRHLVALRAFFSTHNERLFALCAVRCRYVRLKLYATIFFKLK